MAGAAPYRDETSALRARLAALIDERGRLEAFMRERAEAQSVHTFVVLEIESLERRLLTLEARPLPRNSSSLPLGCGVTALVCSAGLLGLTVGVVPTSYRSPRVERAVVGADAVKQAAELYMHLDDPGSQCPTPADLVREKKLDAKKTDDPWGNPYRIECTADGVRVWSNGRDGKANTDDDVHSDFKPADLKRVAEL
jgi:general secretion pathway protein G